MDLPEIFFSSVIRAEYDPLCDGKQTDFPCFEVKMAAFRAGVSILGRF